MSGSVERIRSEQDICNLNIAVSAQSSDGYKKSFDSLSNRVGKTMDIDMGVVSLNAERDVEGIARLKALTLQQRRRG